LDAMSVGRHVYWKPCLLEAMSIGSLHILT
jgi:hypothetical protein